MRGKKLKKMLFKLFRSFPSMFRVETPFMVSTSLAAYYVCSLIKFLVFRVLVAASDSSSKLSQSLLFDHST